MQANFDKSSDTMSLYLTYDAAKPTDCDEAARLVDAFNKAAEKSNSGAFGAFAPLALLGMTANMPKGEKTPGTVTDGIQTAIKATDGKTPYDRGFRNALRYAQWLVDGTVPQYERPAWGNEHADSDATVGFYWEPHCNRPGFDLRWREYPGCDANRVCNLRYGAAGVYCCLTLHEGNEDVSPGDVEIEATDMNEAKAEVVRRVREKIDSEFRYWRDRAKAWRAVKETEAVQ